MINSLGSNYFPNPYRADLNPYGTLQAQENSKNQPAPLDDAVSKKSPSGETGTIDGNEKCETCERRKYKDISNDPGVTFKTPTNVSPGASAAAVATHENQHVQHEQGKAMREGKEIVSQSVQLHTAICPECGRVYVSGGKTTTVTRNKSHSPTNRGQNLDQYV